MSHRCKMLQKRLCKSFFWIGVPGEALSLTAHTPDAARLRYCGIFAAALNLHLRLRGPQEQLLRPPLPLLLPLPMFPLLHLLRSTTSEFTRATLLLLQRLNSRVSQPARLRFSPFKRPESSLQ